MKILKLVTLGPKSFNKEIIEQVGRHDIFVFRINLSHTRIDQLAETIDFIRSNTETPICLDSEGAQIRNQSMENGGEVFFKQGDTITIHFDVVAGDSRNISFTPHGIARQFRKGDILVIDFNEVRLKIKVATENNCQALVESGGMIGSRKAVDLVSRQVHLPTITGKDEQAIELGRKMGVQHFALSFAQSREDVLLFRSKIGKESYLISKIESIAGLLNLEEIIDASDAILIDRGDLSRQVPIEKIPFFQRRIVSLARSRGKKVFVATNLLESMVKTRQPTRAEVNDVISTLDMGANGLVLAAETAMGNYPVECVEMISKLINQFENWTPNTSIAELLSNNSIVKA